MQIKFSDMNTKPTMYNGVMTKSIVHDSGYVAIDNIASLEGHCRTVVKVNNFDSMSNIICGLSNSTYREYHLIRHTLPIIGYSYYSYSKDRFSRINVNDTDSLVGV